ncbi:MAG: bifunctional aspartate kinase/homoserine dehydrogenase I [Sediminibacterium sp.]|nr:bifunctional aspartate kinase/homoserine dehydrogenase I [Sediminibacterium sp.]
MKVLKFGGTSMGSAVAIKSTIKIIEKALKNDPCIVVVSAMSGVTDQLLLISDLAFKNNVIYKTLIKDLSDKHFILIEHLIEVKTRAQVIATIKVFFNELEALLEGVGLIQELSLRTQDKIISFGELMSSTILHAYFQTIYSECIWVDSRQLIKTDENFGSAIVDYPITEQNIQEFVSKNPTDLYIAPGFISSTKQNITTTLGRGGSDYTAAIFASALNVKMLEIWSDVSGMLTADPRLVPNAKKIDRIPYHEALELSYFGAKVIYPPTILPVMRKQIPVYLKNTFDPENAGTLIETESSPNPNIIRGISSYKEVVVVNLEGIGMIGIPGFSRRLFDVLGNNKINVILITQSSSEQSICVVISRRDAQKAKQKIDKEFDFEIKQNILKPVALEQEMAIVAVVGDKMRNHSGISGRMFAALGRNGINVRAIAQGSSEMNISAVINTQDIKKALSTLHEEFFENSLKLVNLFIVGKGNVGSKLLSQLQKQKDFLANNAHIQVEVVGLADSKRFVLNEKGIDLNDWLSILTASPEGSLQDFIHHAQNLNLRNAVFVDITANKEVAELYPTLLKKSIGVVACNKIACSGSYSYYSNLKHLAREYNTSFYFETNVGAGLPIINTLTDLVRSGDVIHSIKAVLSGTLNYVFNNYDGKTLFADVVRKAQAEGFTEPDPRLDLSGTDVMRKILILARECGAVIEISDIKNTSFLPASCMEGSVEDFYKQLEIHEDYFLKLYQNAHENNSKLKFVATFDSGNAWVQLEEIKEDSPFYHLYGKDNIVLFYTNRYNEFPLVVKGAGAGADVTASGIFGDIIKFARH